MTKLHERLSGSGQSVWTINLILDKNQKIILPNCTIAEIWNGYRTAAPNAGPAYEKSGVSFTHEVQNNYQRYDFFFDFIENPAQCYVCASLLSGPLRVGETFSRKEGVMCSGRSRTEVEIQSYHCDECGWWACWNNFDETAYGEGYHSRTLSEGVITRFDPDDFETPIEILRREVEMDRLALHQLDPKACELVVGSIFQDFHRCEAHHVGRSGDEGVDYVLLLGDKKVLLQIKRRSNPQQVEKPAVVRELVGTLVRHDENIGILATTGSGISERQQSNLGIYETKGFDISVYGQEKIRELLAHPNIQEPWKSASVEMIEEYAPPSWKFDESFNIRRDWLSGLDEIDDILDEDN